MNLYGKSDLGFNGWRIDPKENFGTINRQNIFTPKPSDYIRTPSFQPKPSDYIRSPSGTAAAIETPKPPAPNPAADFPHSYRKHYSEQQLRKIGSSSKEDIIEFFKNIGGTVSTRHYNVDNINIEETVYSSPLLPGREYIVSEEGRASWEWGGISGDTVQVSAAKSIQLTNSEIAAVLNNQPAITAPAENPIPFRPDLSSTLTNDIKAAITDHQAKPHKDIPKPTPPAKPADTPPAITKPSAPQNNGNTGSTPPTDTPPAAKQGNTADKADGKTNGTTSPSNAANVQKPEHNRSAASKPDVQPEKQPEKQVSEKSEKQENGSAQAVENLSKLNEQIAGATDTVEKLKSNESTRLGKIHGLKHDLQAEFAHNIVKLHNNELTGSTRDFYAKNHDALVESIHNLRHDTDIIHQKYGHFAAYAHAAGQVAKITGGIGTIADFYELGMRVEKAVSYGDWDPVLGQTAKMVAAAAATTVALGLIRAAAVGVFGIAAAATGPVLIGTIVLGGITTLAISEWSTDLEKEISAGGYWDKYFADAPEGSETGIALVGDFRYNKEISLKADHVALMGEQTFGGGLAIESKTTTLFLSKQAHRLQLESEKVYVVRDKNDFDTFYRQLAEDQEAEQAATKDAEQAQEKAAEAEPPQEKAAADQTGGYTLEKEAGLALPDGANGQPDTPRTEPRPGLSAADLLDGGDAEKALAALTENGVAAVPPLPEGKTAYPADIPPPPILPEQPIPPVL